MASAPSSSSLSCSIYLSASTRINLRLGIYGGTFDPIHNGHLHVIHQLLVKKIVDRLVVIPARDPQLRATAPSASASDRLTMCELAIKELPTDLQSRIEVSSIEIERSGPTYSIDTVEELKKKYPDADLVLVLGTDAFSSIDKWHRAGELKKAVEFVVIDRPDFPGEATHSIDAIKVSATAVRSGDSVDIARSVAGYIKEHNLYGSK